jgi:diguanylate cyclase (GGDEF)-like protein/PAS domain S-box-containing protein
VTDFSVRVPPSSAAAQDLPHLGNAVIALSIVRDDNGSFTDFRVEAVNETAALAVDVDPDEVRGRLTSELPKMHFNREAVERCRAAAATGLDQSWVHDVDFPGTGPRKVRTSIVVVEDTLLMIGEDISAGWEEEHRLAELVARAPVMMTIVDADGSVRWTSPGTRQVLGREPEELLGPPQLDKMHPDDAPMLLAGVTGLAGARRHGEKSASNQMEYRLRHADGRWRWIHFTIEDFTGVEPIDGVVCYGQDVTEQRMAADYAALDGEIHGAIVAGTPFDLVLQSLCDRLIEILDATVVWVGLAEEDGTVSVRGSAGPIREVFRGVSPRWDDTPVGRGPVGECIRQRSTIVTDLDSARRAGLDDVVVESLHRLGINAGVAIPLIADHMAVGALGINLDDPSKLDESTVATLEGIASWIAVAISMNRGRQRERLLAAALAAAANSVAITDSRGRITWVNESYTTTTGRSFADAVGEIPEPLDDPLGRTPQSREMWAAIGNNRSWSGEITGRRRNGELYRVIKTITPLFSASDEIEHFVIIQEDVSELRDAEQQLQQATSNDLLTGLPNRKSFLDTLGGAIDGADEDRGWTVVVCLDLDNFRQVNERDGMEAGDQMLVRLSERLGRLVRSDDVVARLGGDTFAIAVAGIESRDQAVQRLEQVRARLDRLNGEHRGETVSTGVVVVSPDGPRQTAADVLRDADLAMRRAKTEGPGGFAFFDEAIRTEVVERLTMTQELVGAIERGDLMVHYQPQFSLATGRLVGVEALVRWHHPERGMLPPGVFLPLAESAGLIPALDTFVRSTALAQLSTWLRRHPAEHVPQMSLNLSPVEFASEDLAGQIRAEITRFGVPNDKVTIEILETSIVSDDAAHLVQQLSDIGVRLAIDDFGTGYSSLAYLATLPVDELKIDRSFVAQLDQPDDRSRTVVAATITLGHQLGLSITAEGVETAEQQQVLAELACDDVQGFLRSRPVMAETVEALIAEQAG